MRKKSAMSNWNESAVLRWFLMLVLPVVITGRIEWVVKPRNRAVTLGMDQVLPCQATLVNESDPSLSLTYKWHHNLDSVSKNAFRFLNNSLFIPQISERDLGSYTCVVISRQRGRDGHLGPVVELVNTSVLLVQSYIDPFFIDPISQAASVGDKVTLTCVTGKSASPVQVYWLKDGKVFTKGENFTASFGNYDPKELTFQSSLKLTFRVSADTFGVFQCKAVNDVLGVESLSKEANITNKFSPSTSLPGIQWTHPPSLIVADGQNLVLDCKISESTEQVSVGWFIGRFRVDESKRVYILPNNSLAFLPVNAKDLGNYTCKAKNSKGETESPNLELIIAYLGLNFHTQPTDRFAMYGEDVVLPCDPPDSIPTSRVQWYKNYSVLDPRSKRVQITGTALHLISVTKEDKGQYYCVASNNYTLPSSRTSNVATLTVQGPPIMVMPPVSTKVIKGRLLQLTCLVDSDPLPMTTWQLDGEVLPADNSISIVNRGQELSITDIGKKWEGTYTCLARNKFGHISADAHVSVIVPPRSLHPIGDLIVMTGNSLLIHCPVVGDPNPTIHWFFNGSDVPLMASPDLPWVLNSIDLLIEHVTPRYNGTYRCVGVNEAGTASSSGRLTVHVSPMVTLLPANITALIGSSLNLTCTAEGNPVPSLTWLFNSSMQLPKDITVVDKNQTLIISSLAWSNIGLYTCVAQNLVSSAKAAVQVKLLVSPTIKDVHFPESAVKAQTNFTLSCYASGLPPPSVEWTHLGQPVKPTLDGRIRFLKEGVLFVKYAQKSDTGLYDCTASSPVGQVNKSGFVNVYGPPKPPVLVSAVPLSYESVFLVWQWSDQGDITQRIESFEISYRERTSEDTKVYPKTFSKNVAKAEVKDLQPDTTYVFYVSSINDAGTSQPSNFLTTVTLQAGPSAPMNLRPIRISATNASLAWELPLKTNGVVKKYQLRYKLIAKYHPDFTYVNITNANFPTHELFLSPLRPYSEYVVQVRAANIEKGHEYWGNYTSLITFQTLQSKPSLPPQFIQVKSFDPYAIQITWQHIPVLAQNGPILNYHIEYRNINETHSSANIIVNFTVTAFTIRGLSPWRHYTITVRGENQAGLGPASEPRIVTTLPVAPVAAPRQFEVVSLTDSSLKLSWMALPAELITCEVTEYIVKYRVRGDHAWLEIKVLSNSSLESFTHVLESLQAWTWYECQVAAFTETLSPGTGPFTDVALGQVLQGESTPVTLFSYTASSSDIMLSWQPPADVKGVLVGYRVAYQPMENSAGFGDVEILPMTSAGSVVLTGLTPGTVYNISIAAVNGGGIGQELVARVKTLYLPEPTETATADFLQLTTLSGNDSHPFLHQSSGNHVTKNLASIVAGSIVGGIAFIIIAVFICMKCMKYRRKQRLSYAVSTDSVSVEGNAFRPLETPVTAYITPSVIVTDVSSKSSQVHDSQSLSPSQPSTTVVQSSYPSPSALNVTSGQAVEESESQGKEEKKGSRRLSIPRLSISRNYTKLHEDEGNEGSRDGATQGIDNPSFVAIKIETVDDVSLTDADLKDTLSELDSSRLSAVSDDNVSVSSETLRRRNRMRSESAAAIAVLRNSQVISAMDTDILVDNDINTEVIFNERTVL